jgi:hypothetical protein
MAAPTPPPQAAEAECDRLLAAYVKCAEGLSRGLSVRDGECDEARRAYRECEKRERDVKDAPPPPQQQLPPLPLPPPAQQRRAQ